MIGDVFSMILAFVGAVCVIILTYYASKWYATRMGTMAKGRHIKVIDRLSVSKSGSILIIDVEGSQYMVGVSDQNVQIMKELEYSIEMPPEATLSPSDSVKSFLSIFNRKREVE